MYILITLFLISKESVDRQTCLAVDVCFKVPGPSHGRFVSTETRWSAELRAEYDPSLSERWAQGGAATEIWWAQYMNME